MLRAARWSLSDVSELLRLDSTDLKDPPFCAPHPRRAAILGEGIFAVLKRQDVLLHDPYDSFTPVVELIQAAARDPTGLAINRRSIAWAAMLRWWMP